MYHNGCVHHIVFGDDLMWIPLIQIWNNLLSGSCLAAVWQVRALPNSAGKEGHVAAVPRGPAVLVP